MLPQGSEFRIFGSTIRTLSSQCSRKALNQTLKQSNAPTRLLVNVSQCNKCVANYDPMRYTLCPYPLKLFRSNSLSIYFWSWFPVCFSAHPRTSIRSVGDFQLSAVRTTVALLLTLCLLNLRAHFNCFKKTFRGALKAFNAATRCCLNFGHLLDRAFENLKLLL